MYYQFSPVIRLITGNTRYWIDFCMLVSDRNVRGDKNYLFSSRFDDMGSYIDSCNYACVLLIKIFGRLVIV